MHEQESTAQQQSQIQNNTNPNPPPPSNNGGEPGVDNHKGTGGTTSDTSDSTGISSSEWWETNDNISKTVENQQGQSLMEIPKNIFDLPKWLVNSGLLTLEDIQKHIALTQIMRDLPEEKRLQILKIAEFLKRQEDKSFKEADDLALKCYQDLIEHLDQP